MAGSPTDRLAQLDEAVEAASAKRAEAKDRREKERHRQAREVTADLLTFRDDIAHRKPTATPEGERRDRQRELTEAFCADLIERGLVLEAVGNGGGVSIIDPSIGDDFAAADQALIAATRERDAFARENAEAITAEADAAEAARIREALEGDDPEAIREALNPTGRALTTGDFGATRERATSGA